MSFTTHSVKRVNDLVYATPNGDPLFADLYLPQNSQEKSPVIIWVHGGAWRFGDRKLSPDLSKYFTSKGFAMVSIDYRSSKKVTFPGQLYDVKTAIRWVKTIASEYGLDKNKIGLWGSSSGGHLAALAVASGSNVLVGENVEYPEQTSYVQAVVIGYAPIDLLQIDEHRKPEGMVEEDPESFKPPKDTKSTDPDSVEAFFIGAPILTCPNRVKAANPITYVKPGLPPFVIMHGLNDVAIPSHQSELLYKALADEGNEVSLYLIEKLGHGFLTRNHLDDNGYHLAEYRASHNKKEKIQEYYKLWIFDHIEDFFQEKLS